jgi:hypothetical protein
LCLLLERKALLPGPVYLEIRTLDITCTEVFFVQVTLLSITNFLAHIISVFNNTITLGKQSGQFGMIAVILPRNCTVTVEYKKRVRNKARVHTNILDPIANLSINKITMRHYYYLIKLEITNNINYYTDF